MTDMDDIRMQFARADGGAVRLVIKRTPDGVPYVAVERVDHAGVLRGSVAFKREELERLRAGVDEVCRVLLGAKKEVAEVLR